MRLFSVMETAFSNFDETVRNYLAKTFNRLGLEYTNTQVFGVIFNGMKGIMENLMFYVEDAFTEQNIFTASRKRSVFSLAKISGYEPYYGNAATGLLKLHTVANTSTQGSTTKLFIPDKAKIMNNVTGVSYVAMFGKPYHTIDLTKPLIKQSFKVVQGSISSASYISRGYQTETYHIYSSNNFDKQYITVTVDGEEWEMFENIYDMDEETKGYIYTPGYENGFDLMFGDGIHGVKLIEGQTIIISYLQHNGSLGNILPNASSDLSFITTGSDLLGNSVNLNDYCLLTVDTCISGGTESDTIDFVRNMVGKSSRSLVLATDDNFKMFFKRFSFIGYTNVWTEENSMKVYASCLANVDDKISDISNYFTLSDKDLLLTDDQKEMIQTTLSNSNRSFGGVVLEFQDPIIRKFAIICYVKPTDNYNKDKVELEVKQTLARFFINNTEGTQFIAKSDLILEITDSVDNIRSISIDIISGLAEKTFKDGYYYKYVQQYINGSYKYMPTKIMYEEQSTPGMDNYGNISLDTNLEVPLLSSTRYYTNKQSAIKDTSYIELPAVQVIFI